MVERSHHDTGKEDTHASQSRGDCGVDFGSGADWKYGGGLSSGRDQSGAILPLEGRFKKGAIEGIKTSTRRGGKNIVDPEVSEAQKEFERLKAALIESSIELQLLKKSVSSGSMEI